MKSSVLIPYCPLPALTGGKVEMMKHLYLLKEMGECTILSASTRPVGAGWDDRNRAEIIKSGFSVCLREEEYGRSFIHWLGMGYAAFSKALGVEKAFGHSNPYHRYAFPQEWWRRHTDQADIAIVNYSYWAWLPCRCPKVVVLLDLWSDFMWEGPSKEIEDLSTADLVVVISKEEEKRLNEWGIKKTLWSPPAVQRVDLPLSESIGCIGSANKFNIEGLQWLEKAAGELIVKVYGGLAGNVTKSQFEKLERYEDSLQPYRECGIMLLPTSGGMGVQIKAIEALACGRAIVARTGAMRGLPEGRGAWIEVEKPEEMIEMSRVLKSDEEARKKLSVTAMAYYAKYLDSNCIKKALSETYLGLAGR